jgi:ubiquitin-protein ligase
LKRLSSFFPQVVASESKAGQWFLAASSNIVTDISESEYRISITLDVSNDDGDDSEPPIVSLHVRYPDHYPDEPPILDIFPAPNSQAHPYFDVSSDKVQLLSSLKDTVEENMGMAMVFTLVSTLKDLAEQLIAERQAAAREEHEQRILAAEREENKKFHGTPVTPETFAKWRLEFRREMEEMKDREEEAEEAAEKKKNRGKETVERLTGKQLWERGLAGKVEEEYYEEDDDGLPVGGVEKLKVTT